MSNSLRLRLTVIFIGLAIGPLLLVGMILTQRSFTAQQEQALDLQCQVAQRVSTEIEAFLRERESELCLLLGGSRGLEEADRAQQTSLLLGMLRSGPYRNVYQELTVLDDQGREQLCLSRQEIIPAEEFGDRSAAAEFRQPKASGETYFGPVRLDEMTDEVLMTIAVPLFEPRSTQLRGVLVADVRFETVGDLITDLQAGEDQTIYVVDSEGRLVAHPNQSAELQDARLEVSEQGGIQTGLDGTRVVLAVDEFQLGEQRFAVVAERPASEALEPAIHMVFTIAATIVFALAIASSLGFLVAGQIVRPIQRLSATARAISAGDLSQPVNVTSRDEVGELAGAFSHMTVQLRQTLEAQTRFVTILEATPDFVGMTDADGRVFYLNRAGRQMMGLTDESVTTMSIADFYPPHTKGRLMEEGLPIAIERGFWSAETALLSRDGREIPVSQVLLAHKADDDQVMYFSTIIRDITERKRAEETLHRSLQGAARSQRLVMALSQAAQAVQRARTPEEVYRTIGDEIVKLGYHATIFTLSDDRTHLAASYLTFAPAVLRAAEKLAGLSARNYRFRLLPGGFYERIMAEGKVVFSKVGAEPIVEALPGPVRPLAGQLAATLGLVQAIYAPLEVGSEAHRILTVMGNDLTEADVPAVSAFASQAAIAVENARLYQDAQQEIAERKRAEEAREQLLVQIQEQVRRVQQIIDTVPEGVLLLDVDGRAVLANPVAEENLAALANAHVGDTLTRLGDRPLAELLTSPRNGLWHQVRTDGRTFEVIARPMQSGPEPEDWVLVINDVTQEREIQQRVQQQERLAAVGQLAAGIAHDFNNIMATIVLYAQMSARAEGLPDRARERMATINQQAQHATRLIQQILDFGRRAVLERRPLDLLPLLKEQVKLLRRTLPESIRIELICDPDEYAAPLIVHADPTRIQQMVTNLAVNARDAMPEGGDLRIEMERIEIAAGERPPVPKMKAGEWVRVTVSDTGTGILPDVLPRIYEPFFTTKAPLGSGLGLPQVHGIVAQHNGHINVKSRVGEGTTFSIYLPALPIRPPEPSAATLFQELPALAQGQGETILVVEDDTTTRRALAESLRQLNYRILEAAEGQEALALLEQRGEEIALVLSDVVMPGMGGIALLEALKKREVEVGVILLTGHPLEKEMEDLRAQGMTDWLPKPPNLERLAQVVARALREG
jgi:two-component system cell cycle sensor histidine kinase/response regulator CckA